MAKFIDLAKVLFDKRDENKFIDYRTPMKIDEISVLFHISLSIEDNFLLFSIEAPTIDCKDGMFLTLYRHYIFDRR